MDERRDHLRVARQPPDLLLRLPTRVVVRHQELDQQQLQRLRHFSRSLPPPGALPFTAISGAGGGGGGGLERRAKTLSIWRRRLGLWWRRAWGESGGRGLVGQLGNCCLFVFFLLYYLFSFYLRIFLSFAPAIIGLCFAS